MKQIKLAAAVAAALFSHSALVHAQDASNLNSRPAVAASATAHAAAERAETRKYTDEHHQSLTGNSLNWNGDTIESSDRVVDRLNTTDVFIERTIAENAARDAEIAKRPTNSQTCDMLGGEWKDAKTVTKTFGKTVRSEYYSHGWNCCQGEKGSDSYMEVQASKYPNVYYQSKSATGVRFTSSGKKEAKTATGTIAELTSSTWSMTWLDGSPRWSGENVSANVKASVSNGFDSLETSAASYVTSNRWPASTPYSVTSSEVKYGSIDGLLKVQVYSDYTYSVPAYCLTP